MYKPFFALLFSQMFILFAGAQHTFKTDELSLVLDSRAKITALKRNSDQRDYAYRDSAQALVTLVSGKDRIRPNSATFDNRKKILTLQFAEKGVTIDVRVTVKSTHIVFAMVRAMPAEKIDAIIWGPIHNTISKTVGEVIGVVRDGETAIGIQVLNPKTMGGDFSNSEGAAWSRGEAAVKKPWGSQLQAYSINRDRLRFVDAWNGQFKQMPVSPIKGETVVGSSIAFFLCKEQETLDRLEQIELAEGLPHPMVKGVWFKRSPYYGKSYLISNFGEADVDEMIAYTKRAGLISLYHEGPFQSWGHFILDSSQFPHGREGLKRAADKAHAAGLFFGIHTLSNFINTNDPYVTPIPDQRLVATGYSTVVRATDDHQTSIEVASPQYFNQIEGNSLKTVRIGKELIRYKSVSSQPPYMLEDCQRGAFGTLRSSHAVGDSVAKLFDHPYMVFFPNIELQHEIAGNIASLMNETGVDHLDFDGHEGGNATGQGDYGVEMLSKVVFDKVKHDMIAGTSNSKTFYWHIGSYYNWGEPWYGGFKESMQQYRIDNQGLFDRNFMPHMLGWYLLAEGTTLSEMEWMLSRAAGYQAGFAMVARPKALRNNPQSGVLLDAIREWEQARTGGAFTGEQKEMLKDPRKEFHLEKISEGRWALHHYEMSGSFIAQKKELQPGEPTHTRWEYKQQWTSQPLQFRMSASGTQGIIKNIRLQLDGYREILLPYQMKAGESLVADGTNMIRHYDDKGKPKAVYTLPLAMPVLGEGLHTILADAEFSGETLPELQVQFKGMGKKEMVSLK